MTWYAIRTAPRAMAAKVILARQWTDDKAHALERHVQNKTRLEAALGDAGVDYYIPTETKTVINPKSRQKREITQPLIPGFAFVHGVTDFQMLEGLTGVLCVMRSVDNAPIPIPPAEIERLKAAEQAINAANAEMARAKAMTRKRIGKRFPPGSQITIGKGHLLEGRTAIVEAATGRRTIKAIVEQFLHVELPVDAIETITR